MTEPASKCACGCPQHPGIHHPDQVECPDRDPMVGCNKGQPTGLLTKHRFATDDLAPAIRAGLDWERAQREVERTLSCTCLPYGEITATYAEPPTLNPSCPVHGVE